MLALLLVVQGLAGQFLELFWARLTALISRLSLASSCWLLSCYLSSPIPQQHSSSSHGPEELDGDREDVPALTREPLTLARRIKRPLGSLSVLSAPIPSATNATTSSDAPHSEVVSFHH